MTATAALAATLCATVAAQSAFVAVGVGRCVNSQSEHRGGYLAFLDTLDECKARCAEAPEFGGASYNEVNNACYVWLTADLAHSLTYGGWGSVGASDGYTDGMDTAITGVDLDASFGTCYRKEINTAQAGHGLPSTKQQCLDYAAGIGLATNAVDIEATCEPDATAPHGCAPMGCYLSIPVNGGVSVTWNGDAARTQNDNGIRACARRRACVRFPSPGGTIHWTNTTANMLYNFSYVNWGCPRPERLSSFYGGSPGNFRARAQQSDFQAAFPAVTRQTGMSLGFVIDGIEDCVRLCAFMGAGGFQYLDGDDYCAFATPAWIDQAGVTHPTADPADGSDDPWLLQTGNCNDENLHVYSLHALETAVPTALPTTAPTASPVTPAPTSPPTSSAPTSSPSPSPTEAPTASPTASPTGSPSISPSIAPTTSPTSSPTATPTSLPTLVPTTSAPTDSPTASPTRSPSTSAPTAAPTTSDPTTAPTVSPTDSPTFTVSPTTIPTSSDPTAAPTAMPSSAPTVPPTTLESLAGGGGGSTDASADESDGTAGIIVGVLVAIALIGGVGYFISNKRTTDKLARNASRREVKHFVAPTVPMVPTSSIRGRQNATAHGESSTDGPAGDPGDADARTDDARPQPAGSDHQEPSAPLPPKQVPRNTNASLNKGDDPVAPLDLDAFDQMALNHVGEDQLPFGITVKTMNRYKNILPNPHSRVNLQQLGEDPTTSYINANYITSIDGSPHAYIAAQGPKPDCVVPFWRMIWQEEVSVVIMVTGLIERGKSKCSRYWPDRINRGGQEGIIKYGEVIVKVESAKQMVGYKMASFEIKHEGIAGVRKITHFWFDSWPDFGVPNSSVAVLDMLRTAHDSDPEHEAPWLIHCSAGIGRTGTFIGVDSGMQLIDKLNAVDTAMLIEHMRRDRGGMVQTKDQYEFLYNVLKAYHAEKGVVPPSENIYGNAEQLTVHEHLYDNSEKLSDRQSMAFEAVESFYAGVNVDRQASKMYATMDEILADTGDTGPRMAAGPRMSAGGGAENDYATIGGLDDDEVQLAQTGTLRRNPTSDI